MTTGESFADESAVMAKREQGLAPVAPPGVRQSQRRCAFCPLCGREQRDKLASQIGSPEAALCLGRCTVGWQVLAALRLCESASDLIAARRRTEWGTRESQTPTLSEVLLGRWRAGDWAVAPEDLVGRF